MMLKQNAVSLLILRILFAFLFAISVSSKFYLVEIVLIS